MVLRSTFRAKSTKRVVFRVDVLTTTLTLWRITTREIRVDVPTMHMRTL